MAEAGVPARIVIRDDLSRSRVTVFFRLLLAIPHLIWLLLWTIAAVVGGLANWVATLVLGRPPAALHRFLSAYVRYSTHVGAFVCLGANPFPGFVGAPGSYPIDVEIPPPAPQHRLKTLFRIVLVIPAAALSSMATSGSVSFFGAGRGSDSNSGAGGNLSLGILLAAAILGWFAALGLGRMPRGLRNAIAWALGYSAQVWSYLFLLSDRYPNSDPGATGILAIPPRHPVRLRVDDDLRRSRLTVFFRLLLVIPHVIWLVLWGIAAFFMVIFNWFATLVTGRSPGPLFRFLAAYVRYQVHVFAFVTLTANPFPDFLGSTDYPIDLELDGPDRQSRLKTLFRPFLAIPGYFLSSALSTLILTVAFFGWFASLVTGRMPTGFRNVAAWTIRYDAQLNSYLYILTDRYPYAGPDAGEPVPGPRPDEEAPPAGDGPETAIAPA
jgi:hypothetical protein